MKTFLSREEQDKLKLFRTLGEEEKEAFRAWARENYVPFTEIDGCWHPIVQAECVKINQREVAFWDDKTPPNPGWRYE